MICYKCDMCGKIHDSLGEMFNIKVSYAGKANVSFPNNGDYLLCGECTCDFTKRLIPIKAEDEVRELDD